MQILSNEHLTVAVSEVGAELQSLRSRHSGFEYLWQGDAKYWNRRAPVLFPMVGKVWNGEFRMDGRIYKMGQHGFARDCRFHAERTDDATLRMTLDSDASTLALYPRDFQLVIIYSLHDSALRVTWQVTNTGTLRLPFQIGAHPGFNYPDWNAEDDVHGYLSFNVADKLVSTALAPGGYRSLSAADFDVSLDDRQRLPLGNNTFLCDTIIDLRNLVRQVTLHDKSSQPIVRVSFDMPVIALWSPDSGCAPFVCIEPWCGSCDYEQYLGEYEDRDIIHNLLPGETFTTSYDIEIV